MQIRATVRRFQNGSTPDLRKRVAKVSGAGLTKLLEAIGVTLVSMSKRSFATDASLRPLPWKNKKDGSPSTLTKSTDLRKSINFTTAGRQLTIASPKPYAAIHQLGGQTRPHVIRARRKKALNWGGNKFAKSVRHPGSKIPSRPFLPFYRGGDLTVKGARNVTAVIVRNLQ